MIRIPPESHFLQMEGELFHEPVHRSNGTLLVHDTKRPRGGGGIPSVEEPERQRLRMRFDPMCLVGTRLHPFRKLLIQEAQLLGHSAGGVVCLPSVEMCFDRILQGAVANIRCDTIHGFAHRLEEALGFQNIAAHTQWCADNRDPACGRLHNRLWPSFPAGWNQVQVGRVGEFVESGAVQNIGAEVVALPCVFPDKRKRNPLFPELTTHPVAAWPCKERMDRMPQFHQRLEDDDEEFRCFLKLRGVEVGSFRIPMEVGDKVGVGRQPMLDAQGPFVQYRKKQLRID